MEKQQQKNEKHEHHKIIQIGTQSDDVQMRRGRKRDNTNVTKEGNQKRKKKWSGDRATEKKKKEERRSELAVNNKIITI